jgi:hypothetical protein
MSGRAGLKTWKGWSLYLEGLVFIPGRAGTFLSCIGKKVAGAGAREHVQEGNWQQKIQ